MIYQDLVAQTNAGIYTLLLDKLQNSDLALTNSYVTAQRLDSRFSFENSAKDCYFDDLTNAVDVLIATYYSKWLHLVSTFEKGELKDGASSVNIYSGNGSGENSNNVSAYDSNELVNDSTLTTNSKQDYTNTVYDLKGQNLIKSIYTNNFVYDTINTDIRHTLFSNIYGGNLWK